MKAKRGLQVARLVSALAVWWLAGIPAYAQYSGGTGEADDPYQIATAADLIALGRSPGDYNKHFILMHDIDLDPRRPGGRVFSEAVIAPNKGAGWASPFEGAPFAGVFDGDNYTISNLTILGDDYLGLFGKVSGPEAEIKNLALEALNVRGTNAYYVGGLAACNEGTISWCHGAGSVAASAYVGGLVGLSNGTLFKCYSTGTVAGTGLAVYIGGLVGWNNALVTHCYSTTTVSGYSHIGGLVGQNERGRVVKSHTTGAVTGTSNVGGLIGTNSQWGSIAKTYSTAAVTGESSIGGLAGRNYGSVVQSYSTDVVAGDWATGGLVGLNYGSVIKCHSSGPVSGTGAQVYVGGVVGWNDTDAHVAQCLNTGPVSGDLYIGGLAGRNDGRMIHNASTSEVTGGPTGQVTGGFVGLNWGTLTCCYSTSPVSGHRSVGGLAGRNGEAAAQCYSAGAVSGDSYVGGLVGEDALCEGNCYQSDLVTDSFWDTETSGWKISAGGTGKPTGSMQGAGTFRAAGWDFVGETSNGVEDVWWMDGYPRLWWEHPLAVRLPVIELDAADFERQIAAGVILVDFYAAWCPYCAKQAPILEEVVGRLQGRAQVGKLDIDKAGEIAHEYGVAEVPTLILFRQGDEVTRFIGVTSADILVAAILEIVE